MSNLELTVTDDSDDDWFDTLVGINQRWLGAYARLNPSFGISPSLLARNSLWMNTHFQKLRMVASPISKHAKTLLSQHQTVVLSRLRSSRALPHTEAENSTALVEPMAALMYAASVDRCPEDQLENLLLEAYELMQHRVLRIQAIRAGFASCVFRFLTSHSEVAKRIVCLQLLNLLATEDSAAVAHACKTAAQGQLWQPQMFIYTLQKRHADNEAIPDLASELLACFANDLPVSSPIKLPSPRSESSPDDAAPAQTILSSPSRRSPDRESRNASLPSLSSPSKQIQTFAHRPTTTISNLYVDAPSPYSSKVILPIYRPPASATEQARRSVIYSTPKDIAVAGDRRRRCLTPNIQEKQAIVSPTKSEDLSWLANPDSPPKSPGMQQSSTTKRPIALSEKYSWNPDCINSVSGFEWWWRSLPQHHTSLEPTQKLKMVTKAAVRLHTKGEWERAVELYLLALSMQINEEVEFRVRINLGCAYEVGHEYQASEAEFRAALRLNPDDAYAKFKLGSTLMALGQLDEASACIQSVLAVYPQSEELLREIQELREKKEQLESAQQKAVAAARLPRSPVKPGRKLHSNGRGSQLPRIHVPRSPASTPRTEDKHDTERTDRPPLVQTEQRDLIASLQTAIRAKRINLRHTLDAIDVDHTGTIRSQALRRLLGGLLCVSDESFEQLLPHEALPVTPNGIVSFVPLLNALECPPDDQFDDHGSTSAEWKELVESIKREECDYYHCPNGTLDVEMKATVDSHPESDEAIVSIEDSGDSLPNDDVADSHNEDTADSTTYEEPSSPLLAQGPKEEDLTSQTKPPESTPPFVTAPDTPSETAPVKPVADVSPEASTPDTVLSGYDSVSVRINEKRERARQDAILRAERSRVIARKHLHCLKALREVGTRAREHLRIQSDARAFLADVGLAASHQLLDTTTHVAAEHQDPVLPHAVVNSPVTGSERLLQSESDAVASTVHDLVERTVSVTIHCATRNVVVAKGIEELQRLAHEYSVVCRVPPELL